MTTIANGPELETRDWASTFPLTAAWMLSLERATDEWLVLWRAGAEAMTGVVAAQATATVQAASAAFEALGPDDLAETGAAAALAGSGQISQAALHLAEDMGPAHPAFVPLPE